MTLPGASNKKPYSIAEKEFRDDDNKRRTESRKRVVEEKGNCQSCLKSSVKRSGCFCKYKNKFVNPLSYCELHTRKLHEPSRDISQET